MDLSNLYVNKNLPMEVHRCACFDPSVPFEGSELFLLLDDISFGVPVVLENRTVLFSFRGTWLLQAGWWVLYNTRGDGRIEIMNPERFTSLYISVHQVGVPEAPAEEFVDEVLANTPSALSRAGVDPVVVSDESTRFALAIQIRVKEWAEQKRVDADSSHEQKLRFLSDILVKPSEDYYIDMASISYLLWDHGDFSAAELMLAAREDDDVVEDLGQDHEG